MHKGPARIIIEGTSFANTQDIALALSKYPPFIGQKENHRYTTVISAKWGNFRDFPWGKDLIDFDPSEEQQAMKNYGTWVRLIEMQGLYNWIIDRFHVSTQQYQLQNNNNGCDFGWLEERFLKLGFHLVYVVQNEEALRKAIKNRERMNFADDIEAIAKEQNQYREIVKKSILPTLELDISMMSIQEAVGNISDWYDEIYSYTVPEYTEQEKIFLPSCS